MIIVRSQDIANTSRHVSGPGWDSKRMIVKSDGMGYSVHETRILEGTESHLHYKHHLETNYCIAGEGRGRRRGDGGDVPDPPGNDLRGRISTTNTPPGDQRRPPPRVRVSTRPSPEPRRTMPTEDTSPPRTDRVGVSRVRTCLQLALRVPNNYVERMLRHDQLRLTACLAHTTPGVTVELHCSNDEHLIVAHHRLDVHFSPCELRTALLADDRLGVPRFADVRGRRRRSPAACITSAAGSTNETMASVQNGGSRRSSVTTESVSCWPPTSSTCPTTPSMCGYCPTASSVPPRFASCAKESSSVESMRSHRGRWPHAWSTNCSAIYCRTPRRRGNHPMKRRCAAYSWICWAR